MLKKLFIVPWFGQLPSWIELWKKDLLTLKKYGFDYLLVTDIEDFSKRVRDKLKVEPSIVPGTGKPWDFRPMFGVLYDDILKEYDFWGHTDPDCVYGRIDRWMSDEFLSDTDIFGNDPGDICGMFSLYRNCEEVNTLFNRYTGWEYIARDSNVHAFDELGFSKEVVSNCGLRTKFGFYQSNDKNPHTLVKKRDGSLLVDGVDTMVYHFRQSKTYPEINYEY